MKKEFFATNSRELPRCGRRLCVLCHSKAGRIVVITDMDDMALTSQR